MCTFTSCRKQSIVDFQLPIADLKKPCCKLAIANRKSAIPICLALLVLSLLLVPNARAQVLYGSAVGNVTDPNGDAIAGAKVEITSLATGAVITTTTDD